jgi:hypothetical protein
MGNSSTTSKGAPPGGGGGQPGGAPKKASPAIRKLYWRAIQWLLIALGIQTLTSLSPTLIENFYSQGLYLFVPRGLSFLHRPFSFSIAEIVLGLLVAWFLLFGAWGILRGLMGKGDGLRTFQRWILHFVWLASLLFVVFKILWGFNYQRQPMAETLSPAGQRYPLTVELEQIGTRLVNGLNDHYAAQQASPARNVSVAPNDREVIRILSQSIEASFRSLTLIGPAAAGDFPLPKPLVSAPLLSIMGVRSFYFPLTGEVSYNPEIPLTEIPFVIARGKAYQRGYAREDEARFIAYLVCTTAPDPLVRYSGFLHAVEVLDVLSESRVGSFRQQLADGPLADLRLQEEFWGASLNHYPTRLADLLLDFHLRVNRDSRGIDSLRGDIPLILTYSLQSLQLPKDEERPE